MARRANNSPALLIDVARRRCEGEQRAMLREMLVVKGRALLDGSDLPEDERWYLQGVSDLILEQPEPAAEALREAVRLRKQRLRRSPGV